MREGLFLFVGPDNYFLEKELKKREAGFVEKYGKANYLVFNNDSLNLQAIQEGLQGGGLFAQKKMIICKNIPDDKSAHGKPPAQVVKFFEELLGTPDRMFSPDVILVFVSVDPDKRLRLYKLLTEKATVKEFPALTEKHRTTFIKQQLGDFYDESLADYLHTFVGNDLFRLEAECAKILTYLKATGKTTLTEEEKNAIIYSPIQANAFGVLDEITAGNIKKALSLVDNSSASEAQWPEFIGMMYRGLKHILQTIDLYNSGITSSKDIASKIGIHFFPIAKNLKYIKQLQQHQKEFEQAFHEILLLDRDIKSGRIPQEGFWAAIKTIIYNSFSQQNS